MSDSSYPTPFFPLRKSWRTVFADDELIDRNGLLLPSIVASSRQPCLSGEWDTRGLLQVVSGIKETWQEKGLGTQYVRYSSPKPATQ